MTTGAYFHSTLNSAVQISHINTNDTHSPVMQASHSLGAASLRQIRWVRRPVLSASLVSGNYRALSCYVKAASRLLFKWLNRRSQRRSIPWARFRPILKDRVLPRIRIVHNLYPMPIGRTQTGSRMV
jgi:hypothetical protein